MHCDILNSIWHVPIELLLFINHFITGILWLLVFKRVNKMINDNDVIDTLEELDAFIRLVESGGLGFNNVSGLALATHNSNNRPFIAVLDDAHQLLIGRWVTQDVYENGKELVRGGSKKPH